MGSCQQHVAYQMARPVRLRAPDTPDLQTQRRRLLEAYCRHQRPLVDSAQALMGCRSRAEDVVQDAFLKLWEHGTGRGVRDEGKFLFRVVRNLAIDRLRRLALERRHGGCDTLVEQEPAPASSSPEQRVLVSDTLQHVMAAVSELPGRMQRALELHRIEGQTQRDVARQLGVSPTLVNFMLRDALAHCQAKLNSGQAA
jgi:RNA polymerase sigma-70 factor (ECF subfamily)